MSKRNSEKKIRRFKVYKLFLLITPYIITVIGLPIALGEIRSLERAQIADFLTTTIKNFLRNERFIVCKNIDDRIEININQLWLSEEGELLCDYRTSNK